MSMFNKVSNAGSKLFNKNNGNNTNFRKIKSTARQVNNNIQKIGSYLTPVLIHSGNGKMTIQNSLEKSSNNSKTNNPQGNYH